jgi:hypothetical protein
VCVQHKEPTVGYHTFMLALAAIVAGSSAATVLRIQLTNR